MIERPDGTRLGAMVQVTALSDRAGNVVGAIACFHDVTERLREERAARDGERQLREILDSLPVALYTTDAEGRITYFNEAAVELSGRRPRLGDDKWCVTWKLFWPDGTALAHDECPMAVALKEKRAVRGAEAMAERPDGSRIPFIPYPTPLLDGAGELVGAVNVLVDIGHRKEAESRQRLLFAELNHRIKNNMQMLYALLASARRETGSDDARGALDEAARRVAAMAAAQTVLYQSDNLSRFDSGAFMTSVCAAAGAACGDSLALHLHTRAGALANDVAVPLGADPQRAGRQRRRTWCRSRRPKLGRDLPGRGGGRLHPDRRGRGTGLRPQRGPPPFLRPRPRDRPRPADRRALPGRARPRRPLRGGLPGPVEAAGVKRC